MPKYLVAATRMTFYNVTADDPEHAKDEMIESGSSVREIHSETTVIRAKRICKTCDEELTSNTFRIIDIDGEKVEEPTWCPKCRNTDPEDVAATPLLDSQYQPERVF